MKTVIGNAVPTQPSNPMCPLGTHHTVRFNAVNRAFTAAEVTSYNQRAMEMVATAKLITLIAIGRTSPQGREVAVVFIRPGCSDANRVLALYQALEILMVLGLHDPKQGAETQVPGLQAYIDSQM